MWALYAALALRTGALRALVPRPSSVQLLSATAVASETEEPEQWVALAMRERYPILRDISASIRAKRTIEEAELALKIEEDFRVDPSLFADIDFAALLDNIAVDRSPQSVERLETVLTEDELADLQTRWKEASTALEALLPIYSNQSLSAEVGSKLVPKVKRVIKKAREIPLTVELPSPSTVDDIDVGAVLQESKNVVVGLRNVWQRINGRGVDTAELFALQKEAKALLQLRAEATKLRAGIRLVQRQKELKASFLVRSDGNNFLEQTLMADVSIARLEKELSCKVAFLELERIFITLESELRASSSLVDQLLSVVEKYGAMEASLRSCVQLVTDGRHASIDMQVLSTLEADIADVLLQLGLQQPEQEPFSWARTREAAAVNVDKAWRGVQFYGRGTQLIGQDVQLAASMLVRAVLQGYTLRSREVRLLRRILKDLVTLVPFIVILIIPLSPLGHVLVFSFIQRFFPDFFPSAFTESRQELMSMYSSITSPSVSARMDTGVAVGAATLTDDAVAVQAAVQAEAAQAAVEAEEEARSELARARSELGRMSEDVQ